jgi:hypothetical protein
MNSYLTHIARKGEKINHMVSLVDQPANGPYNPARDGKLKTLREMIVV